MEPLIINFEAACPCLWFVSEPDDRGKTHLQSSDLADFWNDDAVCDACFPLEKEYDETCFIDGVFEPHGWKSEAQMKAFNQKMIDLCEFLREHFKGKYEVYIGGFFSDVISVDADSREPVL